MTDNALSQVEYQRRDQIADAMPVAFAALAESEKCHYGTWRFRHGERVGVTWGWYIFSLKARRLGISTVTTIVWLDSIEDFESGLLVGANRMVDQYYGRESGT